MNKIIKLYALLVLLCATTVQAMMYEYYEDVDLNDHNTTKTTKNFEPNFAQKQADTIQSVQNYQNGFNTL